MKLHKGSVSKEEIERIRESADIVQIIGGYVRLKSAGKNFLGLCPFHGEKTPSFVVSPIRHNYHCYGCEAHGDVIRFLMEMEGLQFIEALRFLADRAGITLSISQDNSPQSKEVDQISRCLWKSFHYFRDSLKNASAESPIRLYLKERGVSEKLIETFQLGYVAPGWTNLHDVLITSFPTEIQNRAGLIKENNRGGYYDRLRERLIFPIRDIHGSLIGFSGRSIGNEEPKYLNPPQTELYKKSVSFYGIYESRDVIRQTKKAILVEGYLDVIRLHEKGWKNAIASCGTAVNESHVGYLKRIGVKELILLMDGDAAGIKAATKAVELMIEKGLDSKVVVLPEGLDPDDFFKRYEVADLQSLLDKAPQDIEFLIASQKEVLKDLGIEQQKEGVYQLLQLAEQMKDPIKRELFQGEVAKRFSLTREAIGLLPQNRGQEVKAQWQPAPQTKTLQPVMRLSPQIPLPDLKAPETRLIYYIMVQPLSLGRVRRYVGVEDMNHQGLQALFARFLQLEEYEFEQIHSTAFADLFPEFSNLISFLLQNGKRPSADSFSERAVDELIYPVKMQKIRQKQQMIGQNPEAARALLVEKKELEKQFQHLNHRKLK